jgi:glutaredoxin
VTVPRITLLGRPGCHLCDDARAVISKVADDLGVAWEERDITQSPADLREYWEKIPVTLVDGVQHDFWRVSEDRLRRALRLPPVADLSEVLYFVHLFTNDVW